MPGAKIRCTRVLNEIKQDLICLIQPPKKEDEDPKEAGICLDGDVAADDLWRLLVVIDDGDDKARAECEKGFWEGISARQRINYVA
jgi:hypothetical protein